MAYLVKKKIKGHLYLYAQRSYRLNGKVKSSCTYIGPVGFCSNKMISSALSKEGKSIKAKSAHKKVSAKSHNLNKQFNSSFGPKWIHKYNLQGARIDKLYQSIGFDKSTVNIKITKSLSQTSYVGKSISGSYKITVPIKKSSLNEVKYRKAQHEVYANAALDHIKKNQKHKWSQLKSEMKPSWKASNNLIARYIMTSSDKNRTTKAIIAITSGTILRTYKNRTTANQLGAGGERSTWQQETKNILISLQKTGKKGSLRVNRNKLQRVYKIRTSLEKKYSETNRFNLAKRAVLKNSIKRSNLRIKSVREEQSKIKSISRILEID